MRYGMLVDLKRCIGCHTCTITCKTENDTRPGIFWNQVLIEERGEYPAVSKYFLPRMCMHCENPSCVEVCPTGASARRDDGIVSIDEDKCIGCKYCMVACPYGARYLNEDKGGYYGAELIANEVIGYQRHKVGVVTKCDFCLHRLEQKGQPACAKSCLAEARIFGDLDDPESQISRLIRSKHGFKLMDELGNNPSVYYLAP